MISHKMEMLSSSPTSNHHQLSIFSILVFIMVMILEINDDECLVVSPPGDASAWISTTFIKMGTKLISWQKTRNKVEDKMSWGRDISFYCDFDWDAKALRKPMKDFAKNFLNLLQIRTNTYMYTLNWGQGYVRGDIIGSGM